MTASSRAGEPPTPADEELAREWIEFDWFERRGPRPEPVFKPQVVSMQQIDPALESAADRKLRMLRPLAQTCLGCSMCELGRQPAERNGVTQDPHVLSNMKPSRYMVIGQNPGWDELAAGTPFVGQAGRNFDRQLIANGFTRDQFYICNTVRCWTKQNERPKQEHIDRCEPFLQMELNLLRPKLLVSLGSVAFERLCPNNKYGDCLGKITKSKYGYNTFAVYHPSPLNLADKSRAIEFERQIRILCGLIRRLDEPSCCV